MIKLKKILNELNIIPKSNKLKYTMIDESLLIVPELEKYLPNSPTNIWVVHGNCFEKYTNKKDVGLIGKHLTARGIEYSLHDEDDDFDLLFINQKYFEE